MTAWQPGVLANTLDAELLGAVAAHEFPKPPNRKPAGTCDKLQQADTFLIIKFSNALEKEKKEH